MQNKVLAQRNTLVVGTDAGYVIERYYLSQFGCKTVRCETGVGAARESMTKNYPLIILPVRIAPGKVEDAPDLPELEGIWHSGDTVDERYFEIALQVCRYTRQHEAPNRNSLVIFADTFEPEEDSLLPSVKSRVLDAGADRYFYMLADEWSDAFVDLISERLHWRKQV